MSSRLRTISSLTRKLSLSNSRILINGGAGDRESPQHIGEYRPRHGLDTSSSMINDGRWWQESPLTNYPIFRKRAWDVKYGDTYVHFNESFERHIFIL